MHRDKAALRLRGRSQLEHGFDLLERVCDRVFVSMRTDQANDPVRCRFPQIHDSIDEEGPAAGIISAQRAYPEIAWLVLACDLPFVDEGTLVHLIGERAPEGVATAYKSSYGGLPEPLCAIYEPRSAKPLLERVRSGKNCPRKFLIDRPDVKLIEQPFAHALDNVNTPDDLDAARTKIAESL